MIKNVKIAIDSILANKFRAILTTLGIIFGVAAVIAMLAIGNGAQQKILNQLKIVGTNNLIVRSIFEKEERIKEKNAKTQVKKFSPGLSLKDLDNIKKVSPYIKYISPEVGYDCFVNSLKIRKKSKAIGVNQYYFKIFNLKLEKGTFFNQLHNKLRKNVCVLGGKISKQLFPKSNALGKFIRVGSINLKVIGVIKNLEGVGENLQNMGINNYNNEIYIPVNTLLSRYKNRKNVTIVDEWGWDDESKTKQNPHQLDKIIIQIKKANQVTAIGKLISNIVNRRHKNVADYNLIIPEKMLKQQKETDDLFNWLLGAIAGISLLVGGIGIMNIMLASVMERIREIGLRMSVGARKKDIKQQFVFEALFISLGGGVLGIVLGVILSLAIETFLNMPVKISSFSIFISFFISVLTGVLFGYLPAKKAAEQDPVNSLKYE